jgi:hypothetical protein
MPIAKSDAGKKLNDQQQAEFNEICALLDARITSHPSDVHVSKQSWSPSRVVLDHIKATYEAPEMGWKFSEQSDRDGVILWLK